MWVDIENKTSDVKKAADAYAEIVVAVDDPHVRQVVDQAVSQLELTCRFIEPEQDLHVFLKREPVDLLLLDLELTWVNARQLLDLCVREKPQVRVLAFSAHGDVDKAVQAMKLGASDCLDKPLEINALKSCLRVILDNPGLRRDLVATLPELRRSRDLLQHEIRDLHQAKKAHSESGDRAHALIEATPDTILRFTRSGIVTHYSLGKNTKPFLDAADAPGRFLAELFPPDAARNLLRLLGRLFETDQPQILEFTLEQDAVCRCFEARMVICGSDECLMIVREITDSRLAQEALREERDRAFLYFNMAHAILLVLNPDMTIRQINKIGCWILGWPEERLRGKNWFQHFLPEADRLRIQPLYEELVAHTNPEIEELFVRGGENVVLTSSGDERLVYWRTTCVKDENGKVTATISSGEDVTERRRMERSLAESAERYQAIFENSSEAIFLVSREKVLDCNQAALTMFGAANIDEFALYKPADLSPPRQPDGTCSLHRSQEIMFNVLTSGPMQFEWMHCRINGEPFLAEVRLSALSLGEERIVLANLRDISDRKQTEEQIRASLHEKEILLREIHHRVKNNLQIIHGLLDLQSQYLDDPITIAAFRDSMNRVRSMALIHERLYKSSNLARIDAADYINSLLEYLTGLYLDRMHEIHLDVHIMETPLDIDHAIPCGLIINELLSNALKYAFPPGCGVEHKTISVHFEAGPPPRRINGVADGAADGIKARYTTCCRLHISDNGVGLPPGLDLRNLSTLGLLLVQRLVTQLHGRIDIRREAGTAFNIDFAY